MATNGRVRTRGIVLLTNEFLVSLCVDTLSRSNGFFIRTKASCLLVVKAHYINIITKTIDCVFEVVLNAPSAVKELQIFQLPTAVGRGLTMSRQSR